MTQSYTPDRISLYVENQFEVAIAVGWCDLLRSKFDYHFAQSMPLCNSIHYTRSSSYEWIENVRLEDMHRRRSDNKCFFDFNMRWCRASCKAHKSSMNEMKSEGENEPNADTCAHRFIHSNLFRLNGKWTERKTAEEKCKQKFEVNQMRLAHDRHRSVCYCSPSLKVMLTKCTSSSRHRHRRPK